MQTSELFEKELESNAMLRFLYERSRVNAMMVSDAEGYILHLNEAFHHHYGYTIEDLKGRHARILFIAEDRAKGLPEIEVSTVNSQGFARDRNYVLHKNGQPVFTDGESVLVYSDTGSKYIFKTIQNIHKQVELESFLREALLFSDNLIASINDGLLVISTDHRILRANAAFYRILDKEPVHVEGKSLNELEEPFFNFFAFAAQLQNVVAEQRFQDQEFAYTTEKGLPKVLLVKARFLTDDAASEKILIVLTDVTAERKATEKIRNSEQRFRSLIEEAPVATCLFVGKDMVIEVANQRMIDAWGKGKGVLGKPLAEALPELKSQHFLPLLDELFITGNTYESKGGRADLVIGGVLRTHFFNYTFKPLRNDAGEVYAILEMAEDVTAQVLASKKIEAAEERLRLAIESANLGTYEVSLATNELVTSERFNAIWGIDHSLPRQELASSIHPEDQETRRKAHEQAQQTGHLFYEARIVRPDHSTIWIQVLGKIQFDEANKPTTLIGIVQDITAHKNFTAELQRQVHQRTKELEQAQDNISRNATYLKGILDNLFNAIVSLVPVYEKGVLVDFTFKMVNAAYTQYSKLPPAQTQGRRVSEVFPGYYNTEAFANYRHTFVSGEPSHWDIHYSEDNLDVYLNVVTAKIEGEVIVQIMNITDLKVLQATLEQKIVELERSNTNLEEFAHAASHDLKEPIRKAYTFTNLLKEKIDRRLTSEERALFDRLEYANGRMRLLVEDLLQYSRLSYLPYAKEPVDLNKKLALVTDDLELVIQEAQAKVYVEALPVVPGYRRQMQQLFQNLLSNAIKFRRPDVPPQIWITAQEVLGAAVLGTETPDAHKNRRFYLIEVKDNGIGFDQHYAVQIFKMFNRLHGKSEYEGTGLGLAIASRVIVNHNGYIWAESSAGNGATFKILLPAE